MPLAESTTPDLFYTLTSVQAGLSYRFKITAENVVGESLKSSEIALIASSLPSTPGTPSKVSADDTPQITISWTEPAYDGGSGIVKYKIYMNDTFVGEATSTTYQQTSDLQAGEHYTFQVSAVNAIDEGSLSASVEIIAAQVPDAPGQATLKSASALFIEPQWTAPVDGGSDIRGYKVYKDGIHKTPDFATDYNVLSLVITD